MTPPVNRTSDAQITSSLMGSHHMSAYGGPERLTPRGGPFPGHDPTPALSQLSAYARPHIGKQFFFTIFNVIIIYQNFSI